MRMRDVIICCALLACFITLFKELKFNRDDDREKALTDLNLKLTGIVTNVDRAPGHKATGVIDVKVTSSNVKYYDPRNELKYYYCLIDSNRAEFYDSSDFDIVPGDSLKVDTRENKIFRKHPHGDWSAGPITLDTNEEFYKYVKKHHQKIITQ